MTDRHDIKIEAVTLPRREMSGRIDPSRRAYLEGAVTSAKPTELVLMLHDELRKQIRTILRAAVPGEAGELVDVDRRLGRCREIVSCLMQGLSPESSEIGQNLLGLYVFFLREITETQRDRDLQRLDSILPALESLRAAWAGLAAAEKNG